MLSEELPKGFSSDMNMPDITPALIMAENRRLRQRIAELEEALRYWLSMDYEDGEYEFNCRQKHTLEVLKETDDS